MFDLKLLTWVPLTVYTLAAIPQFIKNLRAGSAAGVSQVMIFIRLTGIFLYVGYIFGCNLPLAYKVMMPLYIVILGSIALQGYWYSDNQTFRRSMRFGYGGVALSLITLLWVGRYYPEAVGMITGWLGVLCVSVCEIPQVYKNYQRKSVQGLSFLFVSMLAVGASIEMLIAVLLGLPTPTLINDLRMITFYAIYCVQFSLYRVTKSAI